MSSPEVVLVSEDSKKNMIQKAVVHHNDIATGRFEDFEVREIKLFLSLISSVENEKMDYLFNAKDIKDFIGMNRDSYKVFEKLIKNLQKKTIEVRTGETTYDSYSIFSALRFDTKEKSVKVIYNPMFKPLIMDFKGNFTKYYLKNIQNMKKSSSLIFYIRSKAEYFKGGFQLSVEEIKNIFKVNYKAIKDIDKYIINPAVEEINDNTDLKLEVEKVYESGGKIKKRVAGYSFKISQNLLASSALDEAVAFAKKNIYISKSKILNRETKGILLNEFSEEEIIAGLKYAYAEINTEFSTLQYLKRIIERANGLKATEGEKTEKNSEKIPEDQKIEKKPAKKRAPRKTVEKSEEIISEGKNQPSEEIEISLEKEKEIIEKIVVEMDVKKNYLKDMKIKNPVMYHNMLKNYL